MTLCVIMTLRVTVDCASQEYYISVLDASIVAIHGRTPVVRHALRVGQYVIIATSAITIHNVAEHLNMQKHR